MLILSRKLNESIVIDGRITVKVMRVDGDVVKLGIAAPAEVPVHRQEVYEEIRQSNLAAVRQCTDAVPRLASTSAAPAAAVRADHAPEQGAFPALERLHQQPNQFQPKLVKPNHI